MSDVLYQVEDEVALITLNRPGALNAFSVELVEGLWQGLLDARADRAVGAVVITGAGRAFSAGGDLRALSADPAHPGAAFRRLAGLFHLCIQELCALPKPVIAAVGGAAAGGGFSLALCCDLRIMADTAFLQQAYTSAGLTPDGGGSYFLPRLVGPARAAEIFLLDERLDAARCEALGLATRVVPRDDVVTEACALARTLAGRSQHALARVKELLAASATASLPEQLERERHAIADAADSPEGREGLRAFVERRPPDFRAARRG
jgi:2-(1,2-epoxy-1,2-dihydrophenyl)acetyl-CoA isomerase